MRTSSLYFNDRSAEQSREQRLSLADTSTTTSQVLICIIHQQDTESQVSHLFAPTSSSPWWTEVKSEEVFVLATDKATHTERRHRDLRLTWELAAWARYGWRESVNCGIDAF